MTNPLFRPSNAARRLACPGSGQMEKDMPDVETPQSREGSLVHALAHEVFKAEKPASHWLNQSLAAYLDLTITDEMVNCVQAYEDYLASFKGYRLSEIPVNFSRWVEDGSGTADAVTMHGHTLRVCDYKHGLLPIEAAQNPQLMIYAAGLVNEYDFMFDFQEITLCIYQPRIDNVDEWTITKAELLDWADTTLKPGALRVMSENPPLVPGTAQCRYCKAAAVCPALAKQNLEMVFDGFNTTQSIEHVRPIEKLNDDEVAALYPALDRIDNWVTSVRQHCLELALGGLPIPEHKVGEKRTHRRWKDKAEAEKRLKRCSKLAMADIYKTELRSPAAIEKAIGKDHALLQELVMKPKGQPVLVPVTDKRPAMIPMNLFDGFASSSTSTQPTLN